jgi:hypothetical protein
MFFGDRTPRGFRMLDWNDRDDVSEGTAVQCPTNLVMSSIMRCELSIRPLSESKASAVEDLYALTSFFVDNSDTIRERNVLYVIPHVGDEVRLVQSLLNVYLGRHQYPLNNDTIDNRALD